MCWVFGYLILVKYFYVDEGIGNEDILKFV